LNIYLVLRLHHQFYSGYTVAKPSPETALLQNTDELIYANIGSLVFFARKGYVIVIPDYRLVPAVKSPASPDDIRDTMLWVTDLEHADEVGILGTP
jgi:hypothetical protein